MNYMTKKLKNALLYFTVLFCAVSLVSASGKKEAAKTSVESLYEYELDNGLKLFVAENDSAPLAYIEVAVRCGAIAQTPETAGLFHLYEHMMFEGDSRYPSSADMDKAVRDMGALGQNAQTGINGVRYFFTVPSALLEKGLEFWSYAIREPLLSEQGLDSQKKVVIAEIEGNFPDPARIYSYNLFRTMFPKYPWRTDPSGSSQLVQNATSDDLRIMLKKYYVPNNAAVFVGGDVRHENVYELVKKIYGSWERADDPWSEERERQLSDPLTETTFRVMPSDAISAEQAVISVYFRGPDAGYDEDFIEIASFFDELMDDPSGFYKQTLLGMSELEISDADHIGEGASFYRENGLIMFKAVVNSPQKDLAERAALFASTVTDKIIPQILNKKDIFTKEQFAQVKRTMKDYGYLTAETAEDLLRQVEYWWENASAEFFFKKAPKIKKSDIDKYLNTYISKKCPLVTVQLNTAVYAEQKNSFAAAGFKEFTQDSAYWWKDYEGLIKEGKK
ncbi:insulinase family protein [Treponema parvum]|uniref:Insulinase family protein n=1 Tax=Treponema parvum TaxID=138851 RepID=A0A975IBW8_9SPIR|nr:pitrilysin family protein [Treponema parvum]QTQ11280.1 insulinase family protein [Treponema parvum]